MTKTEIREQLKADMAKFLQDGGNVESLDAQPAPKLAHQRTRKRTYTPPSLRKEKRELEAAAESLGMVQEAKAIFLI